MSWTVAILPYLGEAELFAAYDPDETWDGPRNARLIERMPTEYEAFQDVALCNCLAVHADDGDAFALCGETCLVVMTNTGDAEWTKPMWITSAAFVELLKTGATTVDGFPITEFFVIDSAGRIREREELLLQFLQEI
ncbi:MAG: hypothetical protein QM811_13960 [Pirellulales bacterium]